jgi:hypothetical protein
MAPSSLLPLLPQMESPSLRMSSSLAVPTYSSPTPSPGTLVSMSAAPTSPSRGTSPRPPLSSACWVSRCAGGELRAEGEVGGWLATEGDPGKREKAREDELMGGALVKGKLGRQTGR